MKVALENLLSKRLVVIVLAALLVLSVFNTYLILESSRSSMSTSEVNYDYVLSVGGNNYRMKNMLTGYIADEFASASAAINSALSKGRSIYLNSGTYVLTDDILIANKANSKIVSDGATIMGYGHKIVVYGDDHTASHDALISGLTIINATIRVENSFATTITNTIFENTSIGIEFANTKTWTEYNKIEDCQFVNATVGIVFRTPVGNATGSYSSSKIDRCSFNLRDFSVGIKVEYLAEFSDSQLQDVRFWLGGDGRANQTAMVNDGSMCQTLLFGVVFESFTSEPIYLFGIDLGETCKAAPLLEDGVSFLGNWTAKVHNPFSIWLAGVGSAFDRQNINVPIGINDQYGENLSIEVHPLKIFTFQPQITVDGSFSNDETITVRIRIEYIDNAISTSVVRTFTSSSSVWLSDNEMLALFPSQNVIWAVLIDAKSNHGSTDANVKVSGYGTAG